jgi:protein N-lysine methyltransferase METTL21D
MTFTSMGSVELAQDKTALRTRKGDTGSVLWMVSVEFAKLVFQQHIYTTRSSFFDYVRLKDAHVLELGAGTGLLAILLAPLTASYTATDVEDLVPLIRKNVATNTLPPATKASVAALDWVTIQNAQPNSISRLLPHPYDNIDIKPDLVIAADCIYHPSLISPLIHTIGSLSSHETIVLVLGQLREVEVIRQFIAEWIGSGWDIWRVEDGGMCILGQGYVAWIGKRRPKL